ncbi:sphingomyelin phosphodiesterase-like [Penaeus indicus]|uniref:sphingomyelin phosphodiesterase-like n=1 Tax=Penaeus indicus TaxID=29960 RepID=UPI00300CA721
MALRELGIVLFVFGSLSAAPWDGRPGKPTSSLDHFLLHALIPEHNQIRDLTCLECRTAAGVIAAMMAEGATVEEIEDQVILDCVLLDLFPPDVCSGMVRLSGAEVLHVLNTTKYDHETVCGWLLGGHCQHTQLDPWTLAVPGGKPEPFHPEPVQPTEGVVRILQLSDLHVDLLYDEGSAAHCEHPYCCRHAFGDPAPGELAAGHWGTLANCDLPLHTLDDLLEHAARTNPDLVYVTGDLPPHDVWAQSHATNLLAINTTVQLIARHFPDVPVLYALGNHASAPVNSFVVPAAYADGWSMAWLYDSLATMWAPWLPEEALPDVRKGGYFSYSPKPGLRVISANMNYCNTLNWWLLLENEDPAEHLQWLIEQLAAAEAEGEAVHLLGHIPPGSGDCDRTWSHVLNAIIARYESAIRGMFFGHTHGDSWQIIYDPEDYVRPVAAAFISPSATTGSHRNPSFRVYTVDGGYSDATWTVMDAHTYNMNMTTANLEGGVPDYTLRYEAQDSYGVRSLTPASLDALVTAMASDDALFRAFYRNVNNYWDEPTEMWTCDTECRKSKLCGLVRGDSSNDEPCQRIQDIVDGAAKSEGRRGEGVTAAKTFYENF